MRMIYKVAYKVIPANEMFNQIVDTYSYTTIDTEQNAIDRVRSKIIEGRERAGFICTCYNDDIIVCWQDGMLCETYSDFHIAESRPLDEL